jgi:hypothetical protein
LILGDKSFPKYKAKPTKDQNNTIFLKKNRVGKQNLFCYQGYTEQVYRSDLSGAYPKIGTDF